MKKKIDVLNIECIKLKTGEELRPVASKDTFKFYRFISTNIIINENMIILKHVDGNVEFVDEQEFYTTTDNIAWIKAKNIIV